QPSARNFRKILGGLGRGGPVAPHALRPLEKPIRQPSGYEGSMYHTSSANGQAHLRHRQNVNNPRRLAARALNGLEFPVDFRTAVGGGVVAVKERADGAFVHGGQALLEARDEETRLVRERQRRHQVLDEQVLNALAEIGGGLGAGLEA